MRKFLLINILLLGGCITSVKLTNVSLRPEAEPTKKIVDIEAQVRNAYQHSCSNNGAMFQLQNGEWLEIKNKFNPNDSGAPFILDGKFSTSTRLGEGCDVIICKRAYPGVGFYLVKYEEVGTKPNPEYKGKTEVNGRHMPKTISVYKSKFLKGHFKARYDYYTDSNCKKKESQEIEFDVP